MQSLKQLTVSHIKGLSGLLHPMYIAKLEAQLIKLPIKDKRQLIAIVNTYINSSTDEDEVRVASATRVVLLQNMKTL